MNIKVLRRTTAYLLTLLLALFLTTAVGAAEPLDPDRRGEIQITLKDHHGIVTGGAFTIWQVGELRLDGGVYHYVVTDAFSGSHLTLEKLTDPELPGKFLSWAKRKDFPGQTEEVDREGSVTFQDLDLGVYLVSQTRRSPGYYAAPAFLVTVPFETEDGIVYRVDASPKLELESRPSKPDPTPKPSSEPLPKPSPKPTEGPETRPPRPDVPETPPVGPETIPPVTAPPKPVAPEPVPTQDITPPDSPSVPHIPQTGQLNWPVPVLTVGGLTLFTLGWVLYSRKDKDHEK